MEIIFCDDKTHTIIHIKNNEIKDKILNFINESEILNNEYSIEFFENENINTKIINCYNTKIITFNCDIIKPLDLTNFINLKKIKYLPTIDLIKLPNNLEEIEFGNNFNSLIDNLPQNIKKIIFYSESKFNQPINNLPIGLEELSLGKNFKNSLDYLPESLKILKFNRLNNIKLDNLPIGIEEISFDELESLNITKLPANLKILKINKFFTSKLDNTIIWGQKLHKLFVPKFKFIEYFIDLKLKINIEELYFTNYFESCELNTFSEPANSFCSKLHKIIKNINLFTNLKKIYIFYSNDKLNKSFFESVFNYKENYLNAKLNYDDNKYFIVELTCN